jgi:hypothetical protein
MCAQQILKRDEMETGTAYRTPMKRVCNYVHF